MAEGNASTMSYRRLGQTDMDVSILGLGSSSFGGFFKEAAEDDCVTVVHEAMQAGINYFDSAPWYGHGKAETLLGKALKDVDRSRYYIGTKVGRYQPGVEQMFDFSAKRTIQSVDESLNRLGLTYVDIVQVHDIEFARSLDIILDETLPALQKVKETGKVRYIGITGYPLQILKECVERSKVKIDTVVSYSRYTLHDTALLDYMDFFKKAGVGVINAAPLAMGLLSQDGPAKWHPAPLDIRQSCAEAVKYCSENGQDLPTLALKFALQRDDIATNLISTTRFFVPLVKNNWEGLEVAKYWRKLEAYYKQNHPQLE